MTMNIASATPTPATLSDEQLAIRKTLIGASEAAAWLGLSKWRGIHEAWALKTGLIQWKPSVAARRGQYLEPLVADLVLEWFSEQGMRVELVKVEETLVHPDHPRIGATIDYIVRYADGRIGLLEIKTKTFRSAQDYGEQGTDQTDDDVMIQVHQQDLVLTAIRAQEGLAGPVTHHVALLRDDELLMYPITISPEIQQVLIDRLPGLYEYHVTQGIAPDPDASEGALKAAQAAAGRALAAAREAGEIQAGTVTLPSGLEVDQAACLGLLADAKARQKAAQVLVDAAEDEGRAQVALLLASVVDAPAKAIVGPAGKLSISLLARTSWKDVAMAAGATEDQIEENTPEPSASGRFYPPKAAKAKK